MPRMRRRYLSAVAVGAALFAVFVAPASAAVPFDQEHFISAIRKASVPTPADVDTHLFALSDANPLLVWRPGSARRQIAVAIVMTRKTYDS